MDAATQGNIQDEAVLWIAVQALTEAEIGDIQKAGELLRPVAGLNMESDCRGAGSLGAGACQPRD